jgi:hypothetical protein
MHCKVVWKLDQCSEPHETIVVHSHRRSLDRATCFRACAAMIQI